MTLLIKEHTFPAYLVTSCLTKKQAEDRKGRARNRTTIDTTRIKSSTTTTDASSSIHQLPVLQEEVDDDQSVQSQSRQRDTSPQLTRYPITALKMSESSSSKNLLPDGIRLKGKENYTT